MIEDFVTPLGYSTVTEVVGVGVGVGQVLCVSVSSRHVIERDSFISAHV